MPILIASGPLRDDKVASRVLPNGTVRPKLPDPALVVGGKETVVHRTKP